MKEKIKLKDIEDFENIRESLEQRFRDWRQGLFSIVIWLGILSIWLIALTFM